MRIRRSAIAVTVVSCLLVADAASGYTFGDWASDDGHSPGAVMPGTVTANSSIIDSLDGVGEFDWTSTPTTNLRLEHNQISSVESGDFSGLTNLTDLSLGANEISSIESGDFSGLTNLTMLDLAYNQQLSSIESGAFSGLTNLEVLWLDNNQLSSIESGTFSGLTNLTILYLHNTALTELNLEAADFSSLIDFACHVDGNANISSVSLRNTVVNQISLATLLDGGGNVSVPTGIGELDGITQLDLSGIDFSDITYLEPLYVMDDLTDLWLVNTLNLDVFELDLLLDNLATIEGISTEGILHMTQADYDAFNIAGGGLLATWDGEFGHHVDFVVQEGDFDGDGDVDGTDFLAWQRGESPYPLSSSDLADWQVNFGTGSVPIQPGDFDDDGDVDGADFLAWQRGESPNPLSSSHLADWQANFGIVATPINSASAAVPEPAAIMLLLVALVGRSFFARQH